MILNIESNKRDWQKEKEIRSHSGVRHQCGQPNVNLRKEAEKNERILQEAESCIK